MHACGRGAGAAAHAHRGTGGQRARGEATLPPQGSASGQTLPQTLTSKLTLPLRWSAKAILHSTRSSHVITEPNCDKEKVETERSHCRQPILSQSLQTTLLAKTSEEASRRHSGEARLPRTRSKEATLPSKSTGAAPSGRGGNSILPRGRGAGRAGGAVLFCMLLLLSLRGGAGAGAEGGAGSLGARLVCARAPLTDKQRALCRAAPAAMAAIAQGLRMAYQECREQLAGRRWNCSGVGDGQHFSHVMPLATREAAFTYAITSAGVTHALGAACARGDLPACGCDHRRRAAPNAQWEWGAGGAGGARCGGEAAYGARLARRFLDARELERDARAAMNLHNNRLGRKMVKELSRRECRCHGVSGSCAVRTCWRAPPRFRLVGAALRDKYLHAKMVTAVERGASLDGQPDIQLVVKRSRGGGGAGGARAARKSELVFLSPSPSYCEPDAAGPGTHRRLCNNTSRGEEGCGALCCGRGYSTARRTERVQCRCRFQWCCRVACDSCLARSELHVCN